MKQITGRSGTAKIKARTSKGPAKFNAVIYTGGALNINGYDLPVVIDLVGLKPGNLLVANLDHNSKRRVGSGFNIKNDLRQLTASGEINASNKWAREVVSSAKKGYKWQTSIEVQPVNIETVKHGTTATANGRTFEGPTYITRAGILKGFAFVSHGADDNTSASIAAKPATYPIADLAAALPLSQRMAAAGAMSLMMLEFACGLDGHTITKLLGEHGIEPSYRLAGIPHFPAYEAVHVVLKHKGVL